ncbi:hypothetical protein GCM10009069_28190 [Algimonas arctica]|uniref:PepSY domain-containing protein n=1 Tax=Algimonas arctica TaxID=1479486 RepID=A0A8J3G3B4_9PROT|nr:PepSY domain-containing protein [Algimonas arctica]GHB03956.1 hypothetical protein GCM10009069_28190 [Algimonas arctica]
MSKAILNRNLRKLHLWFGIGIGLQLGLWLISGLFMTIFSIDHVRGTHLRSEQSPQVIERNLDILGPLDILSKHALAPQSLSLQYVDGDPVYLALSDAKPQIFDAKTGVARPSMTEAQATRIAVKNYAGRSTDTEASFFETKTPREYGRAGPVWRIDFDKPDAASFYVDATTAEIKAVRTGLWRTFDFMWGLHIMDWTNRENFNSWWLKTVAALSVLFFLTGFALVILRLRGTLKRRRLSKGI